MPDIELLRGRKGANIAYVLAGGTDFYADISIASVKVGDWNADLPPWPAPACFKSGGDFGGGGRAFIEELVAQIPSFEASHNLAPKRRIICGYSLAGLCALYAVYVTDMFAGACSVSGSMWYDGWTEFMAANKPLPENLHVYLSVGDKEKNTRNARLSRVEECTRSACEILKNQGADAVFELNPGNHFRDPDKRVARAIETINNMVNSAEETHDRIRHKN